MTLLYYCLLSAKPLLVVGLENGLIKNLIIYSKLYGMYNNIIIIIIIILVSEADSHSLAICVI